MLIACVQSDVSFANVDENRSRIEAHLRECGKTRADLVVMPECMLSGYGYESREEAFAQSLSIDDPLFTELAKTASTHQLCFTFGFLEKSGEKLFNASVLMGASGIIGQYRKVHLPHLGVDRFVDRGDIPYRIHRAGDANIGMAICYDSSFPEPMRVLALAGADIIALGTNWPIAAYRTAEIVPPARSMENHLFFVAANRIGSERGFRYCGLSSICGPDGVVLAKSDDDHPTILYAELDLAQARNKRIERTPGAHVIDRFADRCPSFYSDIVSEQ